MVRVIAIASSDWHYHIHTEFNEENKRVRAKSALISEIYDVANGYNVPVIFPGDLVHNKKQLQNDLFDILTRELPINCSKAVTYAISGNHDQIFSNTKKSRSPNYVKSFSRIIPNFHCVDFRSIDTGKFIIHGIPYITNNENFSSNIKKLKLVKGKPNILMIHTDLPGAKDTNGREVGTVTGMPKDANELFSRFDLVLSGHIHKHQKLGNNLYMLGAPDQQRRSDMGATMGYWKIYSNMKMEFVELKGPKYITVESLENNSDKFNFLIEKPKILTKVEVGKERKKIHILKAYIRHNKIDDSDKIDLMKHYLKGYL